MSKIGFEFEFMFFQWFFNPLEVQNAGYKLNQLLEFHDNNPDENTCYLIKLDSQNVTKPHTQLSILEEAEYKVEEFVPPNIIEIKNIREMRGWDSAKGCYYQITVNWENPNQFIRKINAKIWVKSMGEGPENAQTRQFPVDANSTEATVMLKFLQPYFQYGVTLTFVTDYGKGPESEEISITTLPSSPPSLVKVISSTPDSLEMSWKKPVFIGKSVTLDRVEYKIKKGKVWPIVSSAEFTFRISQLAGMCYTHHEGAGNVCLIAKL